MLLVVELVVFRVLFHTSPTLVIPMASALGMQVNRDWTSKRTIVYSGASFMFQNLFAKSMAFWMCLEVFPISGAKMEVRCFTMFEVTKFMLLMICLNGVTILCTFWRSCTVSIVWPVQDKVCGILSMALSFFSLGRQSMIFMYLRVGSCLRFSFLVAVTENWLLSYLYLLLMVIFV